MFISRKEIFITNKILAFTCTNDIFAIFFCFFILFLFRFLSIFLSVFLFTPKKSGGPQPKSHSYIHYTHKAVKFFVHVPCIHLNNMQEVEQLKPTICEIFMKKSKNIPFCLKNRTWFISRSTNLLCISKIGRFSAVSHVHAHFGRHFWQVEIFSLFITKELSFCN